VRRLYNRVADWIFFHSPARIPTLMEHSVSPRRIEDIESRLAALEAVVDRLGVRQAVRDLTRELGHDLGHKPRRHLASVTPIRQAVEQ
jgi:hypothetical protein